MSSNHTYSQLWQELAPNQPPNCPPMHNYVFNRAFYEGKVGIGGLVPGSDTAFCQRVYEPQSLLHLHTIYRQEPLQYLPENMTFQNWNNAVTIGSDIIPLNATCAIYTEPFDPNFIQTIALRVARKRTNTTPPISGITGDKNYTLISAGHEDDETFVVKGNGKVEIGNGAGTSGRRIPVTPDNDYLLSVDGKIVAREIVVTANSQWADYVFDEEYSLMPLDSLQTYLKEHKHLPDIPTTQQVEQKGINLGDMQTLLLKKVEELTRYIIELHEKNNTLQQQIHTLQQQNSETQP